MDDVKKGAYFGQQRTQPAARLLVLKLCDAGSNQQIARLLAVLKHLDTIDLDRARDPNDDFVEGSCQIAFFTGDPAGHES
jgi:hypothetical protein